MNNLNKILPILGAIAGDIIGSAYELNNTRTKDYNFSIFTSNSTFTDDTVLTIAVAKWLTNPSYDLKDIIVQLCLQYKEVGYGKAFKNWLLTEEHHPYNSYGNGSAMRVSPVALVSNCIDDVLTVAKDTAKITHNHPEGIKGAKAVGVAIFLALNGFSKTNIKECVESAFHYNLSRELNEIRQNYSFNSSCQGSVPEAIIAFLESSDFEDAIRLAVSLGGDADTQASIAGAIAAAFYKKIPDFIIQKIFEILPDDFIKIIKDFIDFLGHQNIRIGSPNKCSFILTSKEDLYIESAIQYTFLVAVTDSMNIFIPKGTRFWVDIINQMGSECHILNNRQHIFSNIEKDLREKFEIYYEPGKSLCSAIVPMINASIYNKFTISSPSQDDIFMLYNL